MWERSVAAFQSGMQGAVADTQERRFVDLAAKGTPIAGVLRRPGAAFALEHDPPLSTTRRPP